MTTSRDAVLERIADALGASPPPPAAVSRGYRRAGEYRADVRRVRSDAIARTVGEVCRELDVRRLALPPGLPGGWRPTNLELVEDTGLTPHELDAVDGVLTGSTLAIAETGTIALAGGKHDGRRALTLVPDLHICVVAETAIVELVPEAVALLSELVARERRPLTLVSGPSATSDIELSRVEGVHGPRTLVVLVAQELGSAPEQQLFGGA